MLGKELILIALYFILLVSTADDSSCQNLMLREDSLLKDLPDTRDAPGCSCMSKFETCPPLTKKKCPQYEQPTSTSKSPLLVCLLPTTQQPIQTAKQQICTTTSLITGPCKPSSCSIEKPVKNCPVQTTSSSVANTCPCTPTGASVSKSASPPSKGIIPLVKSMFSGKASSTITSPCSSPTEKAFQNATIPCTMSVSSEPASIPPAVYEILERLAKDRSK